MIPLRISLLIFPKRLFRLEYLVDLCQNIYFSVRVICYSCSLDSLIASNIPLREISSLKSGTSKGENVEGIFDINIESQSNFYSFMDFYKNNLTTIRRDRQTGRRIFRSLRRLLLFIEINLTNIQTCKYFIAVAPLKSLFPNSLINITPIRQTIFTYLN